MSLYSSIVWIDSEYAMVCHFNTPENDELVALSKTDFVRRDQQRIDQDSRDADDSQSYFKTLTAVLGHPLSVVIGGPDAAKFEFAKYLGAHAHSIAANVIAIQRVDRANEQEVLSIARLYFTQAMEIIHGTDFASV